LQGEVYTNFVEQVMMRKKDEGWRMNAE
jgi:hypothetical protein